MLVNIISVVQARTAFVHWLRYVGFIMIRRVVIYYATPLFVGDGQSVRSVELVVQILAVELTMELPY